MRLFLQGIQALLQFTGNTAAAEGLGGAIGDLSVGQLGFAASAAQEAQDVTDAIASAVSRGVDRADIREALQTELDAALASGNLEAARSITDALMNQTGDNPILFETSIFDYEEQVNALAAGVQEQFNEAIRTGDFAGAGLLADELGTDLRTELARAVEEQDFGLAAILANQLGGSEGVELQSVVASALAAGLSEEAIQGILDNAQGVVDGTTTMSEEVVTAGDNVTTTLQDAGVAFEDFEAIAIARSQGADNAFSQFADNVGYKAAEAAGALQALATEYSDLVLTLGGNLALPGGAGGGGSTTNNTSNVTVNVNQTNNGGAAAAAGGNQVSNWVRGQ